MEYFIERNGRFFAKTGNTGSAVSPIFRIVLTLIPMGVVAAVYFQSSVSKNSTSDSTFIIPIVAIIILSNLIAFIFKKAGFSAGITVDQMERTISIHRPGTQRTSMTFDSIEEITLRVDPGKAAVLSLISRDGTSHLLNLSRDPMAMRQMADELSSLISVTVSEEPFSNN
ncbi:MAG: hypothetical protein K8S62_05635 [Candidatus Sabulitectum sp.]|nr:hypothetical protein [Candidatus Sabulitectum sp.]